jgi:hypothetical protein
MFTKVLMEFSEEGKLYTDFGYFIGKIYFMFYSILYNYVLQYYLLKCL